MTFPVTLRALHERRPTATEDLARRRVVERLREHEHDVHRAAVRLEVAGEGRRRAAVCIVEVVLDGSEPVVAEARGSGAAEAIDLAVEEVGRAVDEAVARKRRRTPRRRAPVAAAKSGRPAVRPRSASTASPEPADVSPLGTARRNLRKSDAGMSYALEGSATTRPSRKSTRRSANRAKPDSNLRRREMRRVRSPKTRAMKGKARSERVTK